MGGTSSFTFAVFRKRRLRLRPLDVSSPTEKTLLMYSLSLKSSVGFAVPSSAIVPDPSLLTESFSGRQFLTQGYDFCE